MDENYYDLDDEFIDDGDLEMNQDDDNYIYNDADTSKFAQSELLEIEEVSENHHSQGSDDERPEVAAASIDEQKKSQDRKYKRLLKHFRVLDAEEVERMI
jgi:hypothetical protein